MENVDLANLQVFISASNTAKVLEKNFLIEKPVPALVKHRLTLIGCQSLLPLEETEKGAIDGDQR